MGNNDDQLGVMLVTGPGEGNLGQSFFTLDLFVGDSAWCQRVRRRIERVANYRYSVLVSGPVGSGKQLIARAIHAHSQRRDRPFIPLDCESLPGDLFASQLDGSGWASHACRGALRCADGGTLLIREVAALDSSQQRHLYDVLKHRPVRTTRDPIKKNELDVRIAASTSVDLWNEVRHGRFRADLYFLLNSVSIETIGLSQRRDDIPALVRHFIAKATLEKGQPVKSLAQNAMLALCEADWPGNIGQLQQVVEEVAVHSAGPEIQLDDLPVVVSRRSNERRHWPTLSEVEAEHIRRTLRATEYDIRRAACMLGIDVVELQEKVRNHTTTKSA